MVGKRKWEFSPFLLFLLRVKALAADVWRNLPFFLPHQRIFSWVIMFFHPGLQQSGKAAEHLLWLPVSCSGGRHMVTFSFFFAAWLHDQPLELHGVAFTAACSDKLKSKLWGSRQSKITPQHWIIYQKQASVHKFTGKKNNKRWTCQCVDSPIKWVINGLVCPFSYRTRVFTLRV